MACGHQRLGGHHRQSLGHGQGGGKAIVGHVPDHAPVFGLLRSQLVASHGQRHGACQAQALHQEPTATSVGNQANFAEGLNEARARCGNGNVAGHGQRGARPRGHAIHGGNDRHAQGLQAARRGVEQALNDGAWVGPLNAIRSVAEIKLGQVGTRTKPTARTRDHHGADGFVGFGLVQQCPQGAVHLMVQTVQS